MKVKNLEGWNELKSNNTDYYGGSVISYAERWAEQMEAELEAGKKIADIAKETSHKADVNGITGFMYGCAVSILSGLWEHGEELRQWHNKDCQLGTEGDKANDEGGVLNPALLSVG